MRLFPVHNIALNSDHLTKGKKQATMSRWKYWHCKDIFQCAVRLFAKQSNSFGIGIVASKRFFGHRLSRFVSTFDTRCVTGWAVDYVLKAGREADNPFLPTETANLKATVAIGFQRHVNPLSEGAIGVTLDDVHNPIAVRPNFPVPFGVGEIVGRRNDDLNLAVVNDEALKGQYADGVPNRVFHRLAFLCRRLLTRISQTHRPDITGTVTVANRPPKNVVRQPFGYGLGRFFVFDFKMDRQEKLFHTPIIALRGAMTRETSTHAFRRWNAYREITWTKR